MLIAYTLKKYFDTQQKDENKKITYDNLLMYCICNMQKHLGRVFYG